MDIISQIVDIAADGAELIVPFYVGVPAEVAVTDFGQLGEQGVHRYVDHPSQHNVYDYAGEYDEDQYEEDGDELVGASLTQLAGGGQEGQ